MGFRPNCLLRQKLSCAGPRVLSASPQVTFFCRPIADEPQKRNEGRDPQGSRKACGAQLRVLAIAGRLAIFS
jgi:hypothetical protein